MDVFTKVAAILWLVTSTSTLPLLVLTFTRSTSSVLDVTVISPAASVDAVNAKPPLPTASTAILPETPVMDVVVASTSIAPLPPVPMEVASVIVNTCVVTSAVPFET